MSNTSINNSDFINRAETIILENISNEQFGVSELAELMNMSRSSLLRKIKMYTQLSASQFIRQVRLVKSRELLLQDTFTVSEISYQVGFGNTSYFIKCFREQYGYSPGEVKKGIVPDEKAESPIPVLKKYKWHIIGGMLFLVVVVLLVVFPGKKDEVPAELEVEKSIAVLPFKNESSDSSNLYFVNGLMESTLSKLQKIKDLRVIGRISVEGYEKTDKTIPELAEELKVNYFVTGSGQKVGDQVLLTIQLIEAAGNRQIWAEQYNRKVVDIFELQNEVALKIVGSVEAIVTPAELEQIEKKPTENLLAYDYYLQGLDPFLSRTNEGLVKAIGLFENAVEQDPEFALAYANIAISYYLLEMFQLEKQYTEKINSNADKALLYDSKSDAGLIAKAFYYIQTEKYKLALPYLNKALEYNPNSVLALQMLADFYFRLSPNTNKYLEYALKGVQLNIAASDSVTQSYICLNLSSALIQNGFVDLALTYINKSLAFAPDNYYAPYLKELILFSKDPDVEQTTNRLLKLWNKDTTRLDILQEVAKFYYYAEDYEKAFYYYEIFAGTRDKNRLDIYPQEDIRIGKVYEKMGLDQQASEYYASYARYCEKDESIYKSASVAMKYANEGKNDKAIEQLKIFAAQTNYQYWILVFMKLDPLVEPLKSHPEYEGIMQKIERRFWENQNTLRKSLEEKGLM